MFTLKTDPEKTGLEKAIDDVLNEMSVLTADSDEYAKMVKHLDTLCKLKDLESPEKLNVNTVLTVAGHIAGIVVIVGYEHKNIITSKALGFVLKLR